MGSVPSAGAAHTPGGATQFVSAVARLPDESAAAKLLPLVCRHYVSIDAATLDYLLAGDRQLADNVGRVEMSPLVIHSRSLIAIQELLVHTTHIAEQQRLAQGVSIVREALLTRFTWRNVLFQIAGARRTFPDDAANNEIVDIVSASATRYGVLLSYDCADQVSAIDDKSLQIAS